MTATPIYTCSDCCKNQDHPLTVVGRAELCDHCVRCPAGSDCAEANCTEGK